MTSMNIFCLFLLERDGRLFSRKIVVMLPLRLVGLAAEAEGKVNASILGLGI
jgi:hypothetical protein